MVQLTLDNINQVFEAFELPDDMFDRLCIVTKLESIFAELRHALEEEQRQCR